MCNNSYPRIIVKIRDDVVKYLVQRKTSVRMYCLLPRLLSYAMLPQFLIYSSILGLPAHISVHFVSVLGPSTRNAR